MRRWEILETRTVRQRRTAAGDKLVNNYRVLGALGRGRFAKVKLCERLTAPAAAVLGDGHGGLDGPPAGPPPTFAAPPPAAAPPRQFAMKIFSKKALVRMKEYVSQPAPRLCGGEEQGGDAPDAAAAGASRMRVVTALDRVRDEIAIMRTLFHRNVVLLFEVMESDDCDKIYLILELMEGGPCMNFQPDTKRFASAATRGPLTEKLAKAYTKDILDGLEYLHGRRICHRDIKVGGHALSLNVRKQ
jgi:[calcium/calmodulin-dependent protein kinase] kinase